MTPGSSDNELHKVYEYARRLEGPEFHRVAIATAMRQMEAEPLLKECQRLPPENQQTFLVAYASMVLWLFTAGFASVLGKEKWEPAMRAILQHFATQGWYEPTMMTAIVSFPV